MTLHAYKSVKRATLVEGASPHRLTEMLYEGSLSNIAIASKHMESGDRQLVHHHIDKALAIVQELQGSLKDYEKNELAANLYDLYSYIATTLLASEHAMNSDGLKQCEALINTLLEAWQSISPETQAA
ncbi:MAG: flagellar export chaperone FliS [Granulosicoccus sp.]